MEIQSVEQMDAIGGARKIERTRRLLDAARGHSWLKGRLLFLIQLVVMLAWLAFFSKGASEQFVLIFVVMMVVSAVEEGVGRRIDALLELLDMQGSLSVEGIHSEKKAG